jgi:hypothetical protein
VARAKGGLADLSLTRHLRPLSSFPPPLHLRSPSRVAPLRRLCLRSLGRLGRLGRLRRLGRLGRLRRLGRLGRLRPLNRSRDKGKL